MNTEFEFAVTMADEDLVAASLRGDRRAFGAIVARYQSLVSAVAYNATGSLHQSEDLAQETFIAAWRKLKDLREPKRLRAWLCGIVRNQAGTWLRQNRREETGTAAIVDQPGNSTALAEAPVGEVISREEEALLWRTLGELPELYREPMILFYRQGESVARVAEALELSEDAVKQRLARGRRLLEERMVGFVEGALKKSVPGSAFTLGVVAALPALAGSASAATLGATAVEGSVAAKSAAGLGLWGALMGPLLGILGGWVGARASIRNTQSPRERKFMIHLTWLTVLGATLFAGAMLILNLNARLWLREHPKLFVLAISALVLTYAGGLLLFIIWGNRRQQQIRQEESLRQGHPIQQEQTEVTKMPNKGSTGATPNRPQTPMGFEYRSRAEFLGWPLVHVKLGGGIGTGRGRAVGWIALGDIAVGLIFAVGGVAVGGIAIGGLSAGLITLGGLAIGGLAMGGWSMGFLALGGGAIGWKFATGGLAVAREFALGGLALADHANDEAARTFLRENLVASGLTHLMQHARWLVLLALLPVFLGMRRSWTRKEAGTGRGSRSA